MHQLSEIDVANARPVEALMRRAIDCCKSSNASFHPGLAILEDVCEKGVKATALDYATKGSPAAFTESDEAIKRYVKEYIFDAETVLSRRHSHA